VKVRVEEVLQILEGFSTVEYVIYEAQQLVVAIVEKDSRDFLFHDALPVSLQVDTIVIRKNRATLYPTLQLFVILSSGL
jgi:hypothetical protein